MKTIQNDLKLAEGQARLCRAGLADRSSGSLSPSVCLSVPHVGVGRGGRGAAAYTRSVECPADGGVCLSLCQT